MKIVLLDGNKIKSQKKLHAEFKKSLNLPEWYGENLDALYDVLTWNTDEIGVIAVNTDMIKEKLGKFWDDFLYLLNDVKNERDNFYLCIEPFKKEE